MDLAKAASFWNRTPARGETPASGIELSRTGPMNSEEREDPTKVRHGRVRNLHKIVSSRIWKVKH